MSTALSTQVKQLATTLAVGGNEKELIETLKSTAFRNQQISDSQMTALLIVANEHKLNPWTNEIYAFPQNGGIQPIIGIDGWNKLANSHPQYDGRDYEYKFSDSGELLAITCKIFRKDRSRPEVATELMVENRRPTAPWKQFPSRMLKHRATAQAIRSAFGFSGIMLEDEAQAMIDTKQNAPEVDKAVRNELIKNAEEAAKSGRESLENYWKHELTPEQKVIVGTDEMKRIAKTIAIEAEATVIEEDSNE